MNSTISSTSFRYRMPSLTGVIVTPKTLTFNSSSSSLSTINFISRKSNTIRACSLPVPHSSTQSPILHQLKTYAGAAVILASAFSLTGRTARAEPYPAVTLTEQYPAAETIQDQASSLLDELLQSSSESIHYLTQILQKKLENREDKDAVEILKHLVSAQPAETEWKFLLARLLNEAGDTQNARKLFEEILAVNPLSFEALFEKALLLARCGEGEAVIKSLEESLRIGEKDTKAEEVRDARFIMAQLQFLQKNVEEALNIYQELSQEDPNDYRPYYCQGMIFSLMDKDYEAMEQFAKYRELTPEKKFDVEAFLPLFPHIRLFTPDD